MTKKSPKQKSLQQEIIMLRTQGFTVRQICSLLQIKSNDEVLRKVKGSLSKTNKSPEITIQEYKALEMNRCDERFGRLAEWRSRIERMNIPIEKQLVLILSLEDREMRNQERLIKLLNLENGQIESQGAIDFNQIRERAAEVDRKRKEIEENPALSGRVR